MSEEPFESLRKLLAVKRHEQPPPGYYDRLANSIYAQLASDPAPSFWKRLRWNIHPAIAYSGAFAAFCGIFLATIYSLQLEEKPDLANFSPETLSLNEPGLSAPGSLPMLVNLVDTNSAPGELPSFLNGSQLPLRVERVRFPR